MGFTTYISIEKKQKNISKLSLISLEHCYYLFQGTHFLFCRHDKYSLRIIITYNIYSMGHCPKICKSLYKFSYKIILPIKTFSKTLDSSCKTDLHFFQLFCSTRNQPNTVLQIRSGRNQPHTALQIRRGKRANLGIIFHITPLKRML